MLEFAKEGLTYITPAFIALVLWRLSALERDMKELKTMVFDILKRN